MMFTATIIIEGDPSHGRNEALSHLAGHLLGSRRLPAPHRKRREVSNDDHPCGPWHFDGYPLTRPRCTIAKPDPREAEWRQFEAEQLAKGRCPHSGEILHRDGEAGPHAASCDMCDCFGYNPKQVKVWPRPLRTVYEKVTRMKCRECGRSFAGNKWMTMCHQCFDRTLTPLHHLFNSKEEL